MHAIVDPQLLLHHWRDFIAWSFFWIQDAINESRTVQQSLFHASWKMGW